MSARLWLVLSIVACGISWLYTHRILTPWEQHRDAEKSVATFELGDLYPRWVGTRELLLHGRNPYGPEVSHEIQQAFYGHAIEQRYDDPAAHLIDEQRFVYPIYVVFLLAPTVHASFAQMQRGAPILFALLVAASVVLCMDALRWRPAKMSLAAMVLFVLASPQIVQGVPRCQFAMPVGFLLALSFWCITRNRMALAGAMLALATIKPQMVILPLAWFLLWSVGEWRKRWPLLAGFVATLTLLILMGELLLPGWPRYFIAGVRAYQKYFPTTSLLWLVFGNTVGKLLSAVLTCGMLFLGWRNRHSHPASDEFARISAMFFVGATIVLPLMTPFNQVLLLLPVMMILRDWDNLARIPRSIFAIVVAWPWLASLVLLIHRPDLDSPRHTPLLPSALVLLLPLVVALLCLPKVSRFPSVPSRTAAG